MVKANIQQNQIVQTAMNRVIGRNWRKVPVGIYVGSKDEL